VADSALIAALPPVLVAPGLARQSLTAPSADVDPVSLVDHGALYHALWIAHNAERERVGLPALIPDGRLMYAAQDHVLWMARAATMAHIRPSGYDPWQRIKDYGYEQGWASENAAAGFRGAGDVMAGWLNSPGHAANIRSKDATHVGFGYAAPGWFVTVFARPR
jgi:uncharacterized protein YkwD